MDTGSYRIAMSMQWLFAIILGTGLFLLPESPRWYVKRNRNDEAALALSNLRGQPIDSPYVKDELAELVANYKYEMTHMQSGWLDCFSGGWKQPSSNLRRVMLGIALQMMQQWTGYVPLAQISQCTANQSSVSTSSSTTSRALHKLLA
jgi:hypothetical protein